MSDSQNLLLEQVTFDLHLAALKDAARGYYCPRCGCPLDPWPLMRPDNCGMPPFAGERRTCMRNPLNLLRTKISKKPHRNYLKAVADGRAVDLAGG